jgi:hypothetical protein
MSKKVNRRNSADALLSVTKALPAAAANNDSDAIYIGPAGPHREGMKLRASWPANSVLVATKLLTLTLKSGATSRTTAEADPAQTYVITGDTGFAAGYVDFELGQNVLDYVAVNQAVETGGGANTGTSFTYTLVC